MSQQQFVAVGPALWMLPSRSMAYNSGVFLSQGAACVIDPGPHPDEVEAMILFIAKQRAEIATMVLTHSHWDHILGPERMRPELMVMTAAYERVVARDRAQIGRMVAHWEQQHGYARTKPFTPPVPSATFVHQISLDVGALSLQLLTAPGHAEDMLMVYEPRSAVLWASDMLSDREIPFVSDRLSAYEATLDKVDGLEIAALVPGHGTVTQSRAEVAERFAADRAYLAELRGQVERALAEGLSVEETVARCAGMTFRFPEENRGAHRLNVESAYLELGGPADPALVGWRKLSLIDA